MLYEKVEAYEILLEEERLEGTLQAHEEKYPRPTKECPLCLSDIKYTLSVHEMVAFNCCSEVSYCLGSIIVTLLTIDSPKEICSECSFGMKEKTENDSCPMCRSQHTEWGSIESTKKAAKKGMNTARNQLACAYRFGTNGLEKNEEKYLELVKLAADDGDVQGLYNLASYYRYLDKDPTSASAVKGIKLFRQAAELGCEMSIGELAISYFMVSNEVNGPESIEAMEYLTLFMASQKRRLVAGRHMAYEKVPYVAHLMGMIFSGTRGLDPGTYGVAKNLYLAKHFFEIAAHLGREKVYYDLGDTIEDIWLQHYSSEKLLNYPGACAEPK